MERFVGKGRHPRIVVATYIQNLVRLRYVLNSDPPAVDDKWDTAGTPVVLSDCSGWDFLFKVENHAN